jgi:hypothetical protein
MHNLLCSSSAHYSFPTLYLSSLKNLILASPLMRGAWSWAWHAGFLFGSFNCFNNLGCRDGHFTDNHFARFSSNRFGQTVHHSTFPLHSNLILWTSQKGRHWFRTQYQLCDEYQSTYSLSLLIPLQLFPFITSSFTELQNWTMPTPLTAQNIVTAKLQTCCS